MKKTFLIIIRWVVGLLFIFSGLVKANDPLGLSYKMQEFFEVWGLQNLNDYTLTLSLVMNVFEVLAGVAVIIGWRMRLFSWLLLLLILFFCFLTGYAYLSGNIKTCGCFGDCLPLTPLTSFIKDVILLLLILVLFANRNNIHTSLKAPVAALLLAAGVAGVVYLQYYVMNYLPLKDCLPFNVGSNIVESMSVPLGARPDSFALTFKYKKNGNLIDIDPNNFPADFDSTYEYVSRYRKLIKKGTDAPKVVDFALQSFAGNDTTISILSQPNYYVLLFVKDFSSFDEWHNDVFKSLLAAMDKKHLPFFVVCSDKQQATQLLHDKGVTILTCDGSAIKTAARVSPTYFVMQVGNIKAKYSYRDIDKVKEWINQAPVNEDFFEFDNDMPTDSTQ
ncbi:MAG TPA: DoxX family protein [Chitinophagaceae bacterium]|nr:DoxX family protein [Chitinophagaceae bacterium]